MLDHGRLRVVVPAIACAVLAACATGGARSDAEMEGSDESAESADLPRQVVVTNHSWERITVYISQGTYTMRLGEVEPNSERAMPLGSFAKALLHGTTYFIGRPLAGRAFRSEGFILSGNGGVPLWTIENHLANSFVTVR